MACTGHSAQSHDKLVGSHGFKASTRGTGADRVVLLAEQAEDPFIEDRKYLLVALRASR